MPRCAKLAPLQVSRHVVAETRSASRPHFGTGGVRVGADRLEEAEGSLAVCRGFPGRATLDSSEPRERLVGSRPNSRVARDRKLEFPRGICVCCLEPAPYRVPRCRRSREACPAFRMRRAPRPDRRSSRTQDRGAHSTALAARLRGQGRQRDPLRRRHGRRKRERWVHSHASAARRANAGHVRRPRRLPRIAAGERSDPGRTRQTASRYGGPRP